VTALLNAARLAEQAAAARPELYSGIARGWIAALPAASVQSIRQA